MTVSNRPPFRALGVIAAAGIALSLSQADDKKTPSPSAAAEPVPVDDDLHHLMEYVFEAPYKRLKKAMAENPSEKAQFKAIKEDSLTLAEATNLLFNRTPEDGDRESWNKLTIETRNGGAALYQAARKADNEVAQKAWRTMLKSCNACHDEFADGEHQLEP